MPSITLNNENIETHYNYITDPEEIRRRVGDSSIDMYKHCGGGGPLVVYRDFGGYTCCDFSDFERRGPGYSRSVIGFGDTLDTLAPRAVGGILLYDGPER